MEFLMRLPWVLTCIMRVIVTENILKYFCSEGTQLYLLVGTSEERFASIFEDAFHQCKYRTTDDEVHAGGRLVYVPLALYLAEYRGVDLLEILKLIYDECEGMLGRVLQQESEQFSKARWPSQRYAQFLLSLTHEVLTEQCLGLTGYEK